MMLNQAADICHCGSHKPYKNCCAVFHQGAAAPTAEALMRSRYSAYILANHVYIYNTWQPNFRPNLADLGGTTLGWFHLSITNTWAGQAGDESGTVSFAASYVTHGKGTTLYETSRFIRQNGMWLYTDGDCKAVAIPRNGNCPCGSSLKFKQCCGA